MRFTLLTAVRRSVAVLLVLGLAACAQSGQMAEKPEHRLIIHIDDNDPAKMNLALNNVANVYDYYEKNGEKIRVELVAYGPGLHIFRNDTSPVKARLETLKLAHETITLSACGNTMKGMEKAEKKPVQLVSDVRIVPAGVTRIIELQEQGWSYIRP